MPLAIAHPPPEDVLADPAAESDGSVEEVVVMGAIKTVRWLTIAISLAWIGLSGGCSSLQNVLSSVDKPTARIVGARLADLTMDGVTIDFDVEVSNPYGVALPLTDMAYQLSSSDATFVSGSVQPDRAIPAQGRGRVTVPASVRFADLTRVLSGVRFGSVVPYRADVTLSADAPVAGLIALPLRHEGTLPVPAVPDVAVQSVQWNELTLQRAAAVVSIAVSNTNEFDATLADFGYSLGLGGTSVAQGRSTSRTKIPSGQKRTIEVPISFAPVDAGMAVFRMLSGKEAGYSIDGDLSLSTPFGDLRMPYAKTGTTDLSR